MAGPQPQPPVDEAQRLLDELRLQHAAAPRRWWRTPALVLATLLALGCGAAYAWAWFQGVRELELLRFTSIYLCLPLAASLLLLFCALEPRAPR